MGAEGVQGLIEADEVARNQLGSLVNELVEGMLTIGTRLSPDNGAGLVVHFPALQIDMLPIALHIQLLQVGTEASQVMIIGQDGNGFGIKEVVLPDAN